MPAPMKFIGGHPALDFVNTVGGWSSDRAREDKLETFQDLVRWAERAGLVDSAGAAALTRLARSQSRQAGKILDRSRELRGVVYRLFSCAVESRSPKGADLKTLQAELRTARQHQTLAATAGTFQWTWDARPALDSVLWRVTQSAADLLTSPDVARVRRCAGEDCGWMFLDISRNHSRQWCDMKDCGNLAKVRRFRARTNVCATR